MLAILLLLPLTLAAPIPHPAIPSTQLFFRPNRESDRNVWGGPQRRDGDSQDVSNEMDDGVSAASAAPRIKRSTAELDENLDRRLLVSPELSGRSTPSTDHSELATDFMLSDDITWHMAHAFDNLRPSIPQDSDSSKRGLSVAQSIANLSNRLFHKVSHERRSSTNSLNGEGSLADMATESGEGEEPY